MTIAEQIRAAQLSIYRAHSITAGAVVSPALSLAVTATNQRTIFLNAKLKSALNDVFGTTYAKNQRIARVLYRINPGYRDDGLSQSAITGAWKAEKYEFELGGNCTANWTKEQRKELIQTGKVKGAEGHHQFSVKYHSDKQADPNNIKFYKTREEHLVEGHGGDFHNESDAPMYDRRQRLISSKRRSVIKNELLGGTITATISFITAASLRFVIEMVKSNRNPEDIKRARNLALIEGAQAAGFALVSYGLAKLSYYGAKRGLELLGIELSEKGMMLLGGSIAAIISSVAVGVITYIKLRKMGYNYQEAGIQAWKAATISLSISLVSALLYAAVGSPLTLGINLIVGLGFASYTLYTTLHEKQLMERLQVLTIEEISKRCLPMVA